jgi:tRNA pseudouridine55 synthase
MPTGIIVIDKPQGLTSNGTLQRVRKAFGAKSAGHVGTLDPMATGMLPICLDEATKVIADIESGGKCYEFTVSLGSRTDTGDAEGRVVETLPVPRLDAARIEAILTGFRGVTNQVPPMYSALKREGRPLYELARQGVEVERAPRRIEIHRLELQAQRVDALDLLCECGKGTYIRVLGEDIARALGTVGHLTRLRRTWVEPFRDHPMVELDAALAGAGGLAGLLPPDAALQSMPRAALSEAQAAAVQRGQAIRHEAGITRGRIRMYGPDGAFMGLAEGLPDGRLQPRRLFVDPPRKPML